MSKGSKRRPGAGYAEGHGRIWGDICPKPDLSYMHPIDKPEDITPDRLRFMCHSLKSVGCNYEAKVLDWVATLLVGEQHLLQCIKDHKTHIKELEEWMKVPEDTRWYVETVDLRKRNVELQARLELVQEELKFRDGEYTYEEWQARLAALGEKE